MANRRDEAKKQEEMAQKSVDVVQVLELTVISSLIGKIKRAFERKKANAEDIADIRKDVANGAKSCLLSLNKASDNLLEENFKYISNDLKGKKPNYSTKFAKETSEYWKKYIKTKGTNFVVANNKTIPQYFTNVVDQYIKEIVDGTTTAENVIGKVVNELSQSGLKVIDYDSGVTRQIDVWARQQVLYAQKQSTQDIREKYAKENKITIFEFDAHPNARPSHQKWQGKRYDTTGKYYPTLNQLTHGEHKDYNCKHRAFPVYDRNDKYMFSKKDLANINTKPFTFKGKEYDGYSGTQLMRQYERNIRALKREVYFNQQQGNDVTQLKAKLRKKNSEYKEIAKKMNTYTRSERLKVVYY